MRTGGENLLASLQAGRAVAAIAVLSCHAEQFARQHSDGPAWLSAVIAQGYLGVDFFFVLSGFIIYYSNYGQAARPGWSLRYSWGRSTRIFVPYLPIALALGTAYSVRPDLAGSHEWNWFSTITLLPSSGEPALPVAWTLQHEVIFYAIMLIMFRFRIILIGCSLWLAAIFVAVVYDVQVIGFALIDIEFIFGIAAAAYFVHGGKVGAPVFALAGVAMLLLASFARVPDQRLVVGAGLAFLILALVLCEEAGRWRVPDSLIRLGAASYAIYLVHVPVLRLITRFAGELGWYTLTAVLIIAGIVAGTAYHVVEGAALSSVRRMLRGHGGEVRGP